MTYNVFGGTLNPTVLLLFLTPTSEFVVWIRDHQYIQVISWQRSDVGGTAAQVISKSYYRSYRKCQMLHHHTVLYNYHLSYSCCVDVL